MRQGIYPEDRNQYGIPGATSFIGTLMKYSYYSSISTVQTHFITDPATIEQHQPHRGRIPGGVRFAVARPLPLQQRRIQVRAPPQLFPFHPRRTLRLGVMSTAHARTTAHAHAHAHAQETHLGEPGGELVAEEVPDGIIHHLHLPVPLPLHVRVRT
jgi:hypothetical protein